MEEITIRKIESTDFEVVYEFINQLESTVFPRSSQQEIFDRNIASPEMVYLLAEQHREILGYLSCHIQWLLHHNGRVAEIQELFVRTDARGKGVGRSLVAYLKSQLKGMGVEQIEVTSGIQRTASHQFYLSQEFKETHKKFVYHYKN